MATGTDSSASSLSPLPPEIFNGLSAISTFALLSLVSTALLFGYLAYYALAGGSRRSVHVNQYVALLINLLVVDLLQALGFTLSLRWLQLDGILAGTPACWTQGWLINAGDVGSAAFTLAIAVHLFSDIVLDCRLGPLRFLATVIFLWVFTIFCATVGIAMHPADFYMRAGLWCWIPETHMQNRLWLHYLWLIITEFGVIIIYSLMFLFLRRRASHMRWMNEEGRLRCRAEAAARSVIAYPLVYVVCTLPAVIARLRIMAGGKVGTYVLPKQLTAFLRATFLVDDFWTPADLVAPRISNELIAVGALLASSGWLDVITYSVTRYSLIFGTVIPKGEIRDFQTLETPTTSHPTNERKNEEPVATVMRMQKIYPGSTVRSSANVSTDSLRQEALYSNYKNAKPGW